MAKDTLRFVLKQTFTPWTSRPISSYTVLLSEFYTYHQAYNKGLDSVDIEPHLLKGHSGAELHIYFLVHLESTYYEIFFYSKIVPNCAVAK